MSTAMTFICDHVCFQTSEQAWSSSLSSVWTIAHVDTLDMPFYQYSNLCSYCTLYFCGFLEEKALNIYLHITHC